MKTRGHRLKTVMTKWPWIKSQWPCPCSLIKSIRTSCRLQSRGPSAVCRCGPDVNACSFKNQFILGFCLLLSGGHETSSRSIRVENDYREIHPEVKKLPQTNTHRTQCPPTVSLRDHSQPVLYFYPESCFSLVTTNIRGKPRLETV